MSSVVAIGANHRSAPLSLLERMALDADRLPKHLDDLLARDHVSEAVVLSTCNRTEIFVVAEKFHGAFRDVRDFLSDLTYLPPDEFTDHLSVSYDADAVRHLFAVTAGLESVVVGEHEILGQVRDAWDVARGRGAAGPVLNLLFRHALEVGKRTRTETAISRHVTSVSHAAVIMATEALDALLDAHVAVVGAGSMARGVVGFVEDASPATLTVLNRTPTRAEELLGQGRGRVRSLSALDAELVGADVVFYATASPLPLLDAERMAPVMERRGGRPLLIVDIAMPRNVDPAVGGLGGVTLLDMDDLGRFAERGIDERRREVPAAEAIVDEEVERYRAAASAREVTPLVVELRRRADDLVAAELDRWSSRLDHLDPEAREASEALVRGVVAKLLHEPTVRLKDAAGTLRGERLAGSLRELFDL